MRLSRRNFLSSAAAALITRAFTAAAAPARNRDILTVTVHGGKMNSYYTHSWQLSNFSPLDRREVLKIIDEMKYGKTSGTAANMQDFAADIFYNNALILRAEKGKIPKQYENLEKILENYLPATPINSPALKLELR